MPIRTVAAAAPLLLLALNAAAPAPASAQDASRLTVERIFSAEFAPDFYGASRWMEDGTGYTRLEANARGGIDIVKYEPASGARSVLLDAGRLVPAGATQPIPIHDYAWSPDGRRMLIYTNSQKVWRYNTRGDYWVLDLASGRLRQLGGADAAPATLMFAKFAPDSRRVAYVRENDIYVEDVESGAIVALTSDGSRTTINGTFDWVYEEELHIQDGFRWSPDGARIAYWQMDATGVQEFMLVNYTDSLYSSVFPVQYPKAGTTNSAARIGIVPSTGGATTWLAIDGDPRNNYLARMEWAASPDEVLVQQLNRRQNTNRLLLGDARTGRTREILVERDDAWLDPVDDLVWFPDGQRFTWISERDGWRHVYVVSRDGRQVRLATPGDYDAWQVLRIDPRGGWVWFIASPDDPTERYLYRARLDGTGRAERITPASLDGNNSYNVSLDGRWAFHTWSAFGTPPVTRLVELPSHRELRTLVANDRLRGAVDALARGPVEFTRLRTGQGPDLDAWIMMPPGFDPARRYPVLFFTYGEPAQSTVRNWWEGSNYLWHLMLTQQGYVVASIDNRGAPAPRGRAFRKAIHRAIGDVNIADQANGARALLSQRAYLDRDRVAVWGWSGGGATTLHLMFRHPDLYATGMAVSPLTWLRLYDTIYQERYTGLPQEDSLAYERGSALSYVDGLRGNLLVVHGSGDDNVHYQNTQVLINALVAAGKPFDMMEYPNRTHCNCEGEGTTEHLFNLLTRYLNDHVPAGGR